MSTAGVQGGFEASAKLALNNTIVRRQAYTFANGVQRQKPIAISRDGALSRPQLHNALKGGLNNIRDRIMD